MADYKSTKAHWKTGSFCTILGEASNIALHWLLYVQNHGRSEMKCPVSGTKRLMLNILFENKMPLALNTTLKPNDCVNKSKT